MRDQRLVQLFDELLVDLRAKAEDAARRNKPTMWAYYVDVASHLEYAVRDGTQLDDFYVAHRLIELDNRAIEECPGLPPHSAARLWAQAVYARRLLAAFGVRRPRPSLTWLYEKAA